MSTNWLDSHVRSPDLELNTVLQPHKSDLHGPTTRYAGPPLADSSAPSWLFGNSPVPTGPAYAQPGELGSGCQHSILLPANTKGQTGQQCGQDSLDEVLHGCGSGFNTCPSKPASSGKRSEAWNAKNRRAQKKFRDKQKVHLIA